MSVPLEKQPDRQRILALLAQQSQLSVDDVARLYEREHAALALGARITKFLHIFALRNVQEILRKRAVDQPAPLTAGRPLLPARRPPLPLLSTGARAAPVIDKSARS